MDTLLLSSTMARKAAYRSDLIQAVPVLSAMVRVVRVASPPARRVSLQSPIETEQ